MDRMTMEVLPDLGKARIRFKPIDERNQLLEGLRVHKSLFGRMGTNLYRTRKDPEEHQIDDALPERSALFKASLVFIEKGSESPICRTGHFQIIIHP